MNRFEKNITEEDHKAAEYNSVMPEYARDVRLNAEKRKAEQEAYDATPEGQAEIQKNKELADAAWERSEKMREAGLEYNPFTDEVERTRPMTPEEKAEADIKAKEYETARLAHDKALVDERSAVEARKQAEEAMNRLHAEAKRENRLRDKGLTIEEADEISRQKAAEAKRIEELKESL